MATGTRVAASSRSEEAAGQVVVRQPARTDQERDERPPEPGIQFEQVAERIADEFPEADQATSGALAAVAAILTPERGPAVQAAGRRLAALAVDSVFPQHPARDINGITEDLQRTRERFVRFALAKNVE